MKFTYTTFIPILATLLSCFAVAQTSQTNNSNNHITDFQVKRDSVWIPTSNGKIFGILYQPIGAPTPTPAVVCLQGGGNVGLNNYLYEAKFFASKGIAALVCDKAGTGRSKTNKNWREQSFIDKANEYMQLHLWLSNRSTIDKNEVGVHGLSEGGRLALYMAIKHPNEIAFVNAVSGPIVSYKENQLYAIRNYLKARSINTLIINKSLAVWDRYLEDISKRSISKETLAAIHELRRLVPNHPYLPSSSNHLPQRPLPEDIDFSLENDLDKMTCPVLLQYGELDILVDPNISCSLIPQQQNFVIITYLETDHSMNLKNGDINPHFLNDKVTWLKDVVLKK